jgi:dipeptidyl aminopeptidase/acylaminoacyl peptidase
LARVWTCIAVSAALFAAAGSAWASFPGGNGRIAYVWIGDSAYRAGPTATSIRTVDPRSGVVRVLRDCPLRTDAPSTYTDCQVGPPSYAPRGTRLAFPITHITPSFTGQGTRFEPGLATMAPNGTSLEEQTTEYGYFAVAWSPAGDQFLLERDFTPPGPSAIHAIFLASLDRTELSQVSPALTQAPDWSSRGEIAFGRYRDASCLPACEDIYITRLGGSTRRLTYRGGSGPSWSPHGTKLAFARPGGLYLVRRNGRGLRRITRFGGSPAWSPDGKRVAFIRNGDLFVIRTNGEDRRRLVNGMVNPDIGEGPQVLSLDWQALPRR